MTVEREHECLVVGAYSRRMTLQLEHDGEVEARIKGKTLKPVCGDRVVAEPLPNEPEWLITDIRPRTNVLTRPATRGQREILAANLDCVVAMAANEPNPDWFVVDRYLAAAEIMHCEGIVVYNKSDIAKPTADDKRVLDEYTAIGYPVFQCSATTGENLNHLLEALGEKTAIVVGQSGVGKSSVINRLVQNGEQRTGHVSRVSGEGRHTTVNSVMLDLANGGAVIDSPGVRDYAPSIGNIQEVIRGFRDIRQCGESCRFTNCVHLREPNCSVKSAVQDGRISARRYESYKRLLNTSKKLAEKTAGAKTF